MRRRLLLVLLPLLLGLLVALEVPLAQTYADRQSQRLFIERLGDADRFAGLANPVLRGGTGRRSLQAELRRYDELYGVQVAVFDADRDLVLASRFGGPVLDARVRRALAAALAGRSPAVPATAWPWRRAPFVLGEPVGQDSQILGAVVALTPTDVARSRVGRRLALLALVGAGILLLATVLCALPLVRWVLRPVRDLSSGAQLIASGRFDARVREDEGPPELRGLAGAFNRMAAGVGAALERQRSFAADASHQLRNPLTTLRLRLESLALHVEGAGERELSVAIEEAERLSATVDMLLRLARAEATESELVAFAPGATAAGRAAAWQSAFAAEGVPLRLTVTSERPARGASEVVEQALDALLDNARKFAAGKPVDLTVRDAGDEVELCVRDRGPGLSEAEIAAAGERFWRSPRDQNVEGTGLGLAIARTLLDGAGARLVLRHKQPGLAASILLPAASSPLAGR
jgi:signal transduction histidine kinase